MKRSKRLPAPEGAGGQGQALPLRRSQRLQHWRHRIFVFLIITLLAHQGSAAPDRRVTEVRTTNSTVNLRTYSSKDEWLARADQLRHQILVSAGLWPTPPKPDLGARVFSLTDHGAYTIEKVYFQSLR